VAILIPVKTATSIVVATALPTCWCRVSPRCFGVRLDASASSHILVFITGGLSLALGVLAFRHFGHCYPILLLAS
jgi:hypothetical protein